MLQSRTGVMQNDWHARPVGCLTPPHGVEQMSGGTHREHMHWIRLEAHIGGAIAVHYLLHLHTHTHTHTHTYTAAHIRTCTCFQCLESAAPLRCSMHGSRLCSRPNRT